MATSSFDKNFYVTDPETIKKLLDSYEEGFIKIPIDLGRESRKEYLRSPMITDEQLEKFVNSVKKRLV